MKIDASRSQYKERQEAVDEYTSAELIHLRLLLRRLQFLEHQVRVNGGLSHGGGSGGAAFAELEKAAFEWLLHDIGFLADKGEA